MRKEETINQFDNWAEDYEEGLWGRYFRLANKKIFALLKDKLNENSRILDVGCGPGLLVADLAAHFKDEVVGLDISPQMIKRAKNRNVGKNVTFVLGDIETVQMNKTFDAVICLNSFHHYEDHKKVFDRIESLLNKGGIYLILDPYRNNFLRSFWTFLLKVIFNEPGVNYFTKKELDKLSSDTGLKLVRQENFLYFALISEYKKV
jgi:2-polyprenyl-3-methyl-5-hydroxy-6-metoxy-1,4-benzoquinol methylase